MGRQWKQCQTLFFWAPKSLKMVTTAMKLKARLNIDSAIKSQDIIFADKGPSRQSYGFSSNHVWM